MAQNKRHFRYQVLTLIGGWLLIIPDGGIWTWGNLSVYVLSYMRMTNIEGTTLQTPWLISIFLLSGIFGVMVTGKASEILGFKPTIAIAILLFDGGLFLSYFSVQHSMDCLNFTNGFMPGFGYGIITCLVTQNAIVWSDGKEGLFTALVQSCSTLGGTLNIQIASHYINPNNETPDLDLGVIKLFTQTDVVRNVPSVYLILGTVNFGVHLIGLILLRDNLNYTKDLPEAKTTLLQRMSAFVKSSVIGGNLGQVRQGNPKINQMDVQERQQENTAGTVEVTKTGNSLFLSDLDTSKQPSRKEEDKVTSEDLQRDKNTKIDYTPSEILRCRTLYLLWLVMFCCDWGYITYTNYYKTFGEFYINNDHLLADIGTATTLVVIMSRIIWGLLVDRFGVNLVMVIFTAILSLLFTTYYFTPIFSVGMYAIWTVLIACVDYNVHANIAIASVKMFGEKHFVSNFGLVVSIGVILNLGAPPLMTLILKNFGWFATFIIPGILNFLSLIMEIALLPKMM